MVSDRKISFQTGDSRYQNKLYKKGPVVFGCAGPVSGLGELRSKIINVAEGFDPSVDIDELQSEVERLAQDINSEFKNVESKENDILVGIQVSGRSAAYCYYSDGSFDPVDDYKAIGSGEPYGSVFLKLLWERNNTMEDSAELGFFIIRYIECLRLNDLVGVNDLHPQIYFIPEKGEIHEADQHMLKRFETSSKYKIERYKNYVIDAYENGSVRHSLETFLSEIKESDIEVAYDIYSWQKDMPEITFREDYTQSDFVDIKGWSEILNKWRTRNTEFQSALYNLSRLGPIKLVPNTKPEHISNRYIITALMVSFMHFNDILQESNRGESTPKWS